MVLVYYIGCLVFEFNELYLNYTYHLIICNITNY